MQMSSSQRWAIGAITLTVLIACSPQAETPPATSASEASAAAAEAPLPPSDVNATPAPEPGFAGQWAAAESDCGNAAKAIALSGQSVRTAPGDPTCAVKSLSEEHPTGRSMIYHIIADCGGRAQEAFTLTFGASDTVMDMRVNEREPVRLVRCPGPATP
jgi:hypothetical protein